jgi:hypothetical protein
MTSAKLLCAGVGLNEYLSEGNATLTDRFQSRRVGRVATAFSSVDATLLV